MVSRRMGMRIPPLRMQMPILAGIGTSVLFPLLRFPLLPSLLQTGTTHNGARLEQRTAGLLLHDPRDRGALPQTLRTPRVPRPAYLLFTSPQPGRREA